MWINANPFKTHHCPVGFDGMTFSGDDLGSSKFVSESNIKK